MHVNEGSRPSIDQRFPSFDTGEEADSQSSESTIRLRRPRFQQHPGYSGDTNLLPEHQDLLNLLTKLESQEKSTLVKTLHLINEIVRDEEDEQAKTFIQQVNTIQTLLNIVLTSETPEVLTLVYTIIASLSSHSHPTVSTVMTPEFVERSFSLLSVADDFLAQEILLVIFYSASLDKEYKLFLIECGTETHLLNYLTACHPVTVEANPNSCCARFRVTDTRASVVTLCFRCLTLFFQDSFPQHLVVKMISASAPFFLCGYESVQIYSLRYAEQFIPHSSKSQLEQITLPNNRTDPTNTAGIPVLNYLICLLREKHEELLGLLRTLRLLKRLSRHVVVVDREHIQREVKIGIETCLKTSSSVLSIFGRLVTLSEEYQQFLIPSGIYPFVGSLFDRIVSFVTSGWDSIGAESLEADTQYFLAACNSPTTVLDPPFTLLETIRTSLFSLPTAKQHLYRNKMNESLEYKPLIHEVLTSQPGVITAADSMIHSFLFFLSHWFSVPGHHSEIVLASLFPDMENMDAKRKVCQCLCDIIPRESKSLLTETLCCISFLASGCLDLQCMLIESGALVQAWNARRHFVGSAMKYFVDCMISILRQDDQKVQSARVLQEWVMSDTFEGELYEMSATGTSQNRQEAKRLMDYLETVNR
ncbi:hypothetical protein BLNAU_15521 [Blattamonas nauphoetae]|uniref:Uncharacterized protein n=1 Tax=Blattamonas nauphoetae TaxID=2049346 RepID=A0ABQ9XFB4_9EUKA|nr:hypothetical protein BLNAU_15521 [Blattamonas nauphoetae]